MRATRDLLRRRIKIVRHGAHLKAYISNTTSQYNLQPNNVSAREHPAVTRYKSFLQPISQVQSRVRREKYGTQENKIGNAKFKVGVF